MRIRLRIAALLAASFVIAGTVVLAIGAVTFQRAVYQSPGQLTDRVIDELGVDREQALAYVRAHPEVALGLEPGNAPEGARNWVNEAFQKVQRDAQDHAVNRSRWWSAGALLAMALAAALAGWVIAGRAVTPLRTITARARAASGADLSGRVALDGPPDEIRELGDTFDEMLDRLERAFVAQRRFSSQVSHEIRTPLAVISSEADLLLRDAEPGSSEHASLIQIRAATDRAERIVGALLVLARSGSGDIETDDLQLDVLAGDVLGDMVNGPDWRQVRVDLTLEAAPVRGDRALLERLVANLLSNAVRHNRPDGWVEVRTRREGSWSTLEVANSVPSADSQPDGPDVADGPDGPDGPGGTPAAPANGVGLTVVHSVLAAHGGELAWDLDEPGRVTATVRLPAAPAATARAAATAATAPRPAAPRSPA
jgi:signal transduction histidine kinase